MTVSRDIQLKVIADAAGFQKEIMKIPGMTEKSAAAASLRMSKEMHKGFQKVGKEAEKSGKQVGGALTVAIGSALAEIGLRMAQAFDPRQILEFMQAAADTQNELSDLSAETGLTVDQLALMRLGAHAAGKELGSLEGAFRPLAKKIGDFTMGTGEAKVGLERLGFTAEDFIGPSGSMIATSDAFDMISKRLNNVESETDKADAAMRIFGEGAGHLINVMAVLGGETSALADFQKTLGLNTDEARQAAAEYQTTMAVLTEVTSSLGQVLLVEMAPAFETFAIAASSSIAPLTIALSKMGDVFAMAVLSTGSLAQKAMALGRAVNTIQESYDEYNASAQKTAERNEAIRRVFAQLRSGMVEVKKGYEDIAGAADEAGEVQIVFKDATGMMKSEALAAAEAVVRFDRSVEGLSEEFIFGETTLSDWNDAIDEGRDRLAGASLLTNMYADIAGQAFDMASAKTSQHRDTLTSLREEYQTLNDELQAVNDKEIERLEFHSERTDLTDEMRKKIKDLANEERSAVEDQMALNKERQKQERQALRDKAQLARKMFRMQKAAAIGQTLINSGEAALSVAAQFPPPSPFFFVGQGLVAGQLAMSLAAIKAQSAPSFHSGGMIQADERMIRARRGEAVLNERATQRLGESTITGLNEGRMMAPITVNVQVGRRQLERVVIDAMNRQTVEAVGTINPYAAR